MPMTTRRSANRSVAEIQRMRRAANAQQFSYAEDSEHAPPEAWVQFKLLGWGLRFVVQLP